MLRIFQLISIILLAVPLYVNAQEYSPRTIGVLEADYTSFFDTIASQWIDLQGNYPISIFIFPVTSSSDANSISEAERIHIENLAEIESERIRDQCQTALPATIECKIIMIPVFTRSDAEEFDPEDFPITNNQIGIILDGDPKIGMEIIANTPVEIMLEEILNHGGIVLGGNMMSQQMIAGFNDGFSSENGLNFHSTEIWNSETNRGLSFGLDNILVESHLFESGLLGRLISAVIDPTTPELGIGIGGKGTGLLSNYNRIENIGGNAPIIIIDSSTYHTSDYASFIGSNYYPSIRNLLIHTLSDNDHYFDLLKKAHSNGDPKSFVLRSDRNINLDENSGELFLGGKLKFANHYNPIYRQFINITGGQHSKVLLIAAGFTDQESAEVASQEYNDSAGVPLRFEWAPPDSSSPIEIKDDTTGIILVVGDPTTVDISSLEPIKRKWLSGTPVLADGEATRLIGKSFYELNPNVNSAKNNQSNFSPNQDGGEIYKGLDFINTNFEIQLISENHWERFVNLAHFDNETAILGIDENSVVEFTSFGALALGDNPIISIDFRDAVVDKNEPGQLNAANGFIDIFAPGETLNYKDANMEEAPLPVATPDLTTPTSIKETSSTDDFTYPEITPKPGFPIIIVVTQQVEVVAKSTPTPIEIPPPADPNWSRMMVSVVIISVLIVIAGVWTNRL